MFSWPVSKSLYFFLHPPHEKKKKLATDIRAHHLSHPPGHVRCGNTRGGYLKVYMHVQLNVHAHTEKIREGVK